jgi:hypothetical protein
MPTIAPKDLTNLRADTIAQIELLLTTIWQLVALSITPWPVKDEAVSINLYLSTITGLLETIPGNIAVIFTDNFDSTHNLLYTLLTSFLGPFGASAAAEYNTLLADIFSGYNANLVANKTSNPAGIDALATSALEEASALGVGSRLVTLIFELFLPKSLNFMNWLGPTLAQFSGYDEIVALWRNPLLRAAIGNLSTYKANAEFLTVAPAAQEARAMLARRLIPQADATKIEGWGGTMVEYQAAQEQNAYRPVPPFLLARAAEAGAIPVTTLTSLLQFAGFRDGDISTLETAYAALALAPYQQQYLVAAVRSTELGTMTPQDLGGVMDDISLNQDQQALVQLTVATRKLEQLAELYRRSISEAYKYGLVTDAQYVPELEAIGIGAADAQAHYAIDSIAKTGKAAAAELRAEARLAAQQQRGGINAAVAEYKAGTTTAAELGAALLLLGVDPTVAAFIVTVQEQRKLGPAVFVYGVELPRAQALVLREKVSALGRQVTAGLVAPADALTALAANNVPDANAEALVASWAATKTPAADVGVLLPR